MRSFTRASGGLVLPFSYREKALAPPPKMAAAWRWSSAVENWTYSADRLQPSAMTATYGSNTYLALGYDYCYPSAAGCTTNNGNMGKQTIGRSSGSWTQTYGYDMLNRLASASETGSGAWSEGYVYDDYGNRALCVANQNPAQTCSPVRQGLPDLTGETPTTIDTTVGNWYLSSNRVNMWGYDAAGSILSMTTPARSFTYDGEGRQVSATAAGLTNTYTYDGEGRRVTKIAWGQTTVYVYDAMGQLAAEYGGAGTDTGTHYLTADALGSARLETSGTAQTGPSVVRNYDYLPFGQEIGTGTAGRDATFSAGYYPSAATGQSNRFTGKPLDAETGLYFFGARYFSGAQGRWMTPDWSATPQPVPYADFGNPQTLNLYTYARNNPLVDTDPDGHCATLCTGAIGFVVGGFVGGAWEAGKQLIQQGKITNGKAILASAAGGAASGGLAGLTLGASWAVGAGYVATATVSGAANVVGGGVTRAINGQKVGDAKAATVDMVAGIAGGVVGKAAANATVRALVPSAGGQKAVSSTFNPSPYDTVHTVVGNVTVGGVQRVVQSSSNAAGNVVSNGGASALVSNPAPPVPPPPAPTVDGYVRTH